MSDSIACSIASFTSCCDGQMSRRYTSFWSGSVVMSRSIRPASAYATHSGGEAR